MSYHRRPGNRSFYSWGFSQGQPAHELEATFKIIPKKHEPRVRWQIFAALKAVVVSTSPAVDETQGDQLIDCRGGLWAHVFSPGPGLEVLLACDTVCRQSSERTVGIIMKFENLM